MTQAAFGSTCHHGDRDKAIPAASPDGVGTTAMVVEPVSGGQDFTRSGERLLQQLIAHAGQNPRLRDEGKPNN